MKEIWDKVAYGCAAVGAAAGYFIGEMNPLVYALIAFVALDYVTGVICAVVHKKLNSEIGIRGIMRKVLIFVLVGMANMLDAHVLGQSGVLRGTVLFFYIANEGISIVENIAATGVPVPEKIKNVLQQLKKNEEQKAENEK